MIEEKLLNKIVILMGKFDKLQAESNLTLKANEMIASERDLLYSIIQRAKAEFSCRDMKMNGKCLYVLSIEAQQRVYKILGGE